MVFLAAVIVVLPIRFMFMLPVPVFVCTMLFVLVVDLEFGRCADYPAVGSRREAQQLSGVAELAERGGDRGLLFRIAGRVLETDDVRARRCQCQVDPIVLDGDVDLSPAVHVRRLRRRRGRGDHHCDNEAGER